LDYPFRITRITLITDIVGMTGIMVTTDIAITAPSDIVNISIADIMIRSLNTHGCCALSCELLTA
jgi:hypothetical protein